MAYGDATVHAIDEAMAEVAQTTIPAEIKKDFDVGGRSPFEWQDLEQSTKDKKARYGGDPRILVDGHEPDPVQLKDGFVFDVEKEGEATWVVYVSNIAISARTGKNKWWLHYDGHAGMYPQRVSGQLCDEAVELVRQRLNELVKEKRDALLAST